MQHSTGFLSIVNDAKTRVKEITINELQQWQEQGREFTLVDVREDSEWQKGNITGAIHIGKGVIERDIEKTIPNKSQVILLYCSGGFRSVLASDMIQKMGYTHVHSLTGGSKQWFETLG